ncbi:MAG TPA: Ig-like domain-containing protein [Methylomirabilota bacterium]|nr:Ig-like domain-containing protein [Methylomirabilota bacterium]
MLRVPTAMLVLVMVLLAAFSGAGAQSLVAGGLTALPPVNLGSSLVTNGGFETLNGSLPAGWTGGTGWNVDQLVRHSGTFSYRRTTGAPSASQTIQLRQGVYKFSAWIKTELATGSSGVRLLVDFRPGVFQWITTDLINGTKDWTLYELKNIVVPEDRTAIVSLENFAGASGTAWFDDAKFEEQLAQPVDVFLLYPNYRGMLFDDQPQTMKFDVTVTPPGGDFGRFKVTGTLKDEATGQVVATQSYPASAHFVAELSGSLMQAGGGYLATFALVEQANGSTVYTYPGYRVSKAPGAARQSMNISFDAKNRLLVRGTPRFVLGVYDSGMGYNTTDAYWENLLWSPTGERRMDGLKINFYLNYWYGEASAEAMKALMGNLQKHGVAYLQTGNCFDKFAAGQNFFINNSNTYVQDIGAQAGSAGYYTIDECQSALIPGAFTQYQRLRNLDPDSMTFAALLGNPDIVLWRDAADVLSSDPYPLFGPEPAGGYNHKQVADWTAMTRQAVKDARPFMTVLQFFKFTSQGRFPTLGEMRSHAYMAIVEGAKGLFWWSLGGGALRDVCAGWCDQKTTFMNNLKTVVGEVAALEPVLLADDTPGALTGNSNPPAIRTKVKVVNGTGYLFAYNYNNQTVSTTFTWQTAPGTVTVNAENRTVAASGSSFSDTFGPWEAHVYVIANGGSGGTPTPTPTPTPSPTPITVSFTNPQSSATVSGTSTVTMTASGGSGSYTFKLAVDANTVYTGTNGTFGWNTTTVANGGHTLTATVTDSNGASGTATRTVTVSNTTTTPTPTPTPTGGLTVAITQPRSGATLSGTAWLVVWVQGSNGSNTFTLRVDGQAVSSQAGNNGPVSMALDTTKVANGSHTLTVGVRDGSGKTGTRSVSVTTSNATTTPTPTPTPIPTPAPSPTPTGSLKAIFTGPTNAATVSGTVVVDVWVEGQSGTANTFTLAADGRVVTAQTIAGAHATLYWPTTGLTNGTHTLTATVKDATGKTGTSSISVTVRN